MSASIVANVRKILARKQRKDSHIKYGDGYGPVLHHLIISIFGVWPTYVFNVIVTIPYFALFRTSVRKADYFYLSRRFPGQNKVTRFIRYTRHIFSFAQVLVDQAAMGILGKDKITIDFPNANKLFELSRKRRGLIVVTAHVGNFLGSIITTDHLDVPTNVVLDTRNFQGNHFFDLSDEEASFKIIPPSLEGMVTATNALQAGEIVVIMGDRKEKSRTIPIEFLGKKAQFPVTPYHLAMATGADVGILLTARTGKLTFRLEFEVIREGQQWQDLDKEEGIRLMAESYARHLQAYVGRYPLMWYNFFDFWE